MGQLTASFNKMAEDLKKTTTSIDNLNREITEREQTEKMLQTEKNNLKAIFASSPVGMLLLDEATMIVDANTVATNM